MPPTNWVSTYGPPSRRSNRVNELKVWHWIMMTTASPRIQSRNGNRFTEKPQAPGASRPTGASVSLFPRQSSDGEEDAVDEGFGAGGAAGGRSAGRAGGEERGNRE